MDLNGWQNNNWPIYWTCLQNILLCRTCIRSQELRVEQFVALDSRFQQNLTDGFHEITVADFLPRFPYILASNCLYYNGISEKKFSNNDYKGSVHTFCIALVAYSAEFTFYTLPPVLPLYILNESLRVLT